LELITYYIDKMPPLYVVIHIMMK